MSTGSWEAYGSESQLMATAASTATGTAAAAIFEPIAIQKPLLIARFFWYNGATASGNVNVGVYDRNGNLHGTATALTAQAGVNAIQAAAPSGGNFTLAPGQYYMAVGFSSATATFFAFGHVQNGLWSAVGTLQQTAGITLGALPATATMATDVTLGPTAGIPIIGMTSKTTV